MMKLERFKEKNKKRIGIILFTMLCILLISGAFLYRSFAIFEVTTHQNVIKGRIEEVGDLYFAFYVDNQIQTDIPSEEEGYRLDPKSSYCSVNGVKDSNISVSMTNDWIVQINGMITSRTKCNLYFKKAQNFLDYIQTLPTQIDNSGNAGLYSVYHTDANITWNGTEEQIANLKLSELRYAGKNYNQSTNPTNYVYNYVDVDGQVWRVIGLVNTPDGQRIKLVKDESIGRYLWDFSLSSINSGYGVNEWSESKLMRLLNPGYDRNILENLDGTVQEDQYVNNSLYWNGEEGMCYALNSPTSCDFTDKKIPERLKSMIDSVIWNTGSDGGVVADSEGDVNNFYNYERSSNSGKICNDVVWCNDNIVRKTSWKGKVGLIYPSDYGYATSGGSQNSRISCLDKVLNLWKNSDDECHQNDWIYQGNEFWTLSPGTHSSLGSIVFTVITQGGIYAHFNAVHSSDIRPAVYLSPNVLLVSGDGSFENKFLLSL